MIFLERVVVTYIGISILEEHYKPVWIIKGCTESQKRDIRLPTKKACVDLRDCLKKQQILEFALDICRAVPTSSIMIEHNGCRTKYMFRAR